MSIRLHLVVEGQTEETFVNQLLKPHLANFSVWADVRSVETSRRKTRVYRGGVTSYKRLRGDLKRWMREDQRSDVWFSTMIDLYGLSVLQDSFPGYEQSKGESDAYKRVEYLERQWDADMAERHFIPYLQLHEFEALVLVDPAQLLREFNGIEKQTDRLVKMVGAFDSPELINDGANTSPSKRIIAEIPAYEGRKRSLGPIITSRVGLTKLRSHCPHFKVWLERLENLPNENRNTNFRK
ncbi:MAG: DUF4276 family protein [Candidatus Zixiibacteriota bacterium]